MNRLTFQKYLPVIFVVLTLGYFGYRMMPPRGHAGDFNYREFGHIMCYDGGRLKPIDTVARTNLMIISHRQTLYDQKGNAFPATKWFLDCLATPIPGDRVMEDLLPRNAENPIVNVPFIRIENDQVIALLQLERKPGLRFSISDIAPKYKDLAKEAARVIGDEDAGIKGVDPKNMNLFDAKVAELWQHLNLFLRTCGQGSPLVIPNPDGTDQWKPFREGHMEYGRLYAMNKLPKTADARTYAVLRQLITAYSADDKRTFNRVLGEYIEEQRVESPTKMRAIGVEIFFNEFAPFYRCLEVYIVLALIGALTWFPTEWSRPVKNACLAAMAVAFVFHLSGLVIRMYLQDRMFVFVTNLYSSAVFIGLGCVLVCMISEWIFKNGIALVIGNVTGFCSLIIAHMLSMSGDTLEMMQAVLDTNFWLATHVTCITLGYTAAFVAGFMGIAYILLGIFTEKLRGEGSANLTRMTYGVLCTGMFLSFVGTVLGGLWADYSWGRFWGWDPKENGALLIVIWIALILHARWGGMVKHRGIAVLSVLGIIVTSWSWFGTNFLGVGLHSYGFRQGAMVSLVTIDFGFLAIAGLGCFLPLNMWASFRPPGHAATLPTDVAPKPA